MGLTGVTGLRFQSNVIRIRISVSAISFDEKSLLLNATQSSCCIKHHQQATHHAIKTKFLPIIRYRWKLTNRRGTVSYILEAVHMLASACTTCQSENFTRSLLTTSLTSFKGKDWRVKNRSRMFCATAHVSPDTSNYMQSVGVNLERNNISIL